MQIDNKTLVVFPGAGSPSNPLYSKVYGLIESGALKFGYKSVDLSTRWPGQQLASDSDVLSLNFHTSLEVAARLIGEYEASGVTPYDILGRSYGTYVALKIAELLRPKFLRRLILWGTPPFWRMWQIYARDFNKSYEVAKTKEVLIGRDMFPSLEPIEPLICASTYPVIIASGTADIYSTPRDVASFRALAGNDNVEFRPPVEGAPHEVTEDSPSALVDEYLKALFCKCWHPTWPFAMT